MKPAAARYILYGQICFYLGLVVCAILKPYGLAANAGISFYGDYRLTIVPYIFAMFGLAIFNFKAASQIHGQKLVSYSLIIISVLIIGIAVTPDSLSHPIVRIHIDCAYALSFLQLLLSFYLVKKLGYRWPAILLALIELAAGVASFLYLAPPEGLLLQAQIVFQAAFAGLLIYAFRQAAFMGLSD